MRSASLYRISGNCLILAAVIWTISELLLPRGAANTVAEVVARVGPIWMVSGALGIIGTVLAIPAMVGLYRHFTGGEGEGWALLGATTGVTGSILVVAGMTTATIGVSGLLRMVQTGGLTPAEPAEAALIWTVSALSFVGGTLMWLALVPLGVAMLRDPVWTKVMAWGALAFGVVEAVAGFVFMGRALITVLLSVLGFAFLAWVGNALTRIPRRAAPAPAPAIDPGATV